jgi:hypothetical protein
MTPMARWFLDCAHSAHNMLTYGGEFTAYDEWIEFLREVCGYERDKRVDFTNWHPWNQATLHGGVRIMHERFCIIADRPSELHIETVNGRGRLHNASGPAKRYSGDGWSIYAIHGVRVPEKVVMAPETLTAEEIRKEQNAEVRRIMIDRFGAARYLAAIDAKVVHEDRDRLGFTRRLLSADIGDVEPLVMIELVNSTPEPIGYEPDAGAAGVWVGKRWHKIYTLRVDPRLRPMYRAGDPRGAFGEPQQLTCQNAAASLCGMTGAEYAPLLET